MTSYDLNPFYIKHLLSSPGIGAIERLVFREILDFCWMDDAQDRVEYNGEEMSQKIGISEEELEKSIERLSDSKAALIKFYVDLDADIPSSMISVPYLTDILEKMKREDVQEKTEDFSTEAMAKNTISIVDRIRSRDAEFEPTILFLERSERAMSDSFSGWLPTKNFDRNGEAYNVKEHIIESLKKSFAVNPDHVFKEMFTWLMENPKRRPGMKTINDFIYRWFSNYDDKIKKVAGKSSDGPAIDQEALTLLSDL